VAENVLLMHGIYAGTLPPATVAHHRHQGYKADREERTVGLRLHGTVYRP
jgi:hypothetical protein